MQLYPGSWARCECINAAPAAMTATHHARVEVGGGDSQERIGGASTSTLSPPTFCLAPISNHGRRFTNLRIESRLPSRYDTLARVCEPWPRSNICAARGTARLVLPVATKRHVHGYMYVVRSAMALSARTCVIPVLVVHATVRGDDKLFAG